MTKTDREELARLREADQLRKRKAAAKRAAARARFREGIEVDASTPSVEMDLLLSVLQYAEERMREATWPPDDMRAAELAPLTLDVVDVPKIREMVRRYAEALSNAWRFSSEHPAPYEDVPACSECGAPRLEVRLVVSDRPYAIPGRHRPVV